MSNIRTKIPSRVSLRVSSRFCLPLSPLRECVAIRFFTLYRYSGETGCVITLFLSNFTKFVISRHSREISRLPFKLSVFVEIPHYVRNDKVTQMFLKNYYVTVSQ